jgi:hypothetical protein
VTTVQSELLHGRWVISPDDFVGLGRFGEHAFHFSPWGDAIHSFVGPQGMQRIVLIWRIEGEELVTIEPGTGRAERSPVALAAGGALQIGAEPNATFYVRDSDTQPFDSASRAYAFGAAALRHGLTQVAKGLPFEPFLLTLQAGQLELSRFHYPTAEAAEEAAKRKAEGLPKNAVSCAWVYDAFLTTVEDQQRTAAVMALVSERGDEHGRVFAQRYRYNPIGEPIGPMAVTGQKLGWLKLRSATG